LIYVFQCLNFIMCNTLATDHNIEMLCAIVKLIALLKPLNEHDMLEYTQCLIEEKLYEVWDSLDLEQVVQLIIFVKPGICDRVHYMACSILVDKFYPQFRVEYQQTAHGKRFGLYCALACSGESEDGPSHLSALEQIDLMHMRRENVIRSLSFKPNALLQSTDRSR
uniref:Rab-GAP TBC domain-containing protein n=1 Tax=Toxocara canis TaxID=6265 RepID=A0A183U2M2_TOXCA